MRTETFSDTIALLKADHDTVEGLFEMFKEAHGNRWPIARKACTLLKVHMVLEEEILYPALRGKVADDKLDEGLVEHDSGKILINDILAAAGKDEVYATKFHVLSEHMVHHHHEEEEYVTGIFAEARKSGVDLVALRDQMLTRRIELEAEAKAGELPPSDPTYVDVSES